MITLPSVFSDGVVLAKTAKVWGYSAPRSFVIANFLGKEYETVTDDAGKFVFTFNAKEYGGPHKLQIEDLTINEVYIGRVWFCGGQSNMQAPLKDSALLLGEYIKPNPQIRVFQAEVGHSFTRVAKDVKGSWNTADGGFLEHMYAVPYFFARHLLKYLPDDGVPLGLLCAPAGGTSIEAWLPEDIVYGHPDLYEKLLPLKEPGYVERALKETDILFRDWHMELDKKDRGLLESWHLPEYDDSEWSERVILDSTGSPEYGSVWLRRKFTLPDNNDALLNLGRFQHCVTVYINGKELVHIGWEHPPCRAPIPPDMLNDGENTIALRIMGSVNHPKAVPGKPYEVLYNGGRLNLSVGKWKWKTGTSMEKCRDGAWFYTHPCGTYNHMLAPLLGYSIEGFLWYQGESNSAHPHSYKALFTEFVEHIRKHFGENIPIIYTQIANYIDPYSYHTVGGFGAPGSYWAILREQQRKCLSIENTAMAVTIDCGEYNDLHPADKKTVGDRLALHARRMVYGEDIVSDGPTVEKAELIKSEERVIIHFKNGEGLWAKGGHPLMFVIDRDGSVHSVYASIFGNTMVASVGTLSPVVVRFGWADCPSVPIYNAYNLPASPFEEIISEGEKTVKKWGYA